MRQNVAKRVRKEHYPAPYAVIDLWEKEGGFGDRAPRRDFGDRPPPRREFSRDEGGPTYDIAGTVKWFDQVRGFGFVTPEDGGQDVFLHSSVLQRAGKQDVQQGEKVALEVRDGQRGRQAVNMKD